MSQVAVITGSGRGLGRALAERFAAAKARVAVSYHTSAQGAEETAEAVRQRGGEAFVQQCDVREYAQVQALVQAAVDHWGRIDVFVNNAGEAVAPWRDRNLKLRVHEISEEEWDLVIDSNLGGNMHGIRAVAPVMMKQREGHIINVSSGSALRGRLGFSHYAAAKLAILGLTKTAAQELGQYNIRVNAVCPGLIMNEKHAQVALVADHLKETTLGRLGKAGDFAEAVYQLAQWPNVSGQTFIFESRILR